MYRYLALFIVAAFSISVCAGGRGEGCDAGDARWRRGEADQLTAR